MSAFLRHSLRVFRTALVVLLALAAPAAGAAEKPLTDAQVTALLRGLDDAGARLKKLQTQPALDTYAFTKAQHWLLFAESALTGGDRGPVVEAAFSQGTNLLAQLEAGGADLSRDTPALSFVPAIRPDLWQLATTLKQQPNFAAGAAAVARLEVQLVWAAYDYKRLGWRAAKPTLEKAEEFAAAARAALGYAAPVAAPAPTEPAGPTGETGAVLNLDLLQQRLSDLNAHGVPLRSYAFAKAQHWLDFARAQHEAKDKSGIVAHAAQQTQRILQQLQTGDTNAAQETPLFKTVKQIRPDLWQQAAEMKRHLNFAAAADRVAQLEVQLVWAGHEYGQLGWRTARPHLAAAERFAKEAQALLSQTASARPPAPVPDT
jgi:hypothetical protein